MGCVRYTLRDSPLEGITKSFKGKRGEGGASFRFGFKSPFYIMHIVNKQSSEVSLCTEKYLMAGNYSAAQTFLLQKKKKS